MTHIYRYNGYCPAAMLAVYVVNINGTYYFFRFLQTIFISIIYRETEMMKLKRCWLCVCVVDDFSWVFFPFASLFRKIITLIYLNVRELMRRDWWAKMIYLNVFHLYCIWCYINSNPSYFQRSITDITVTHTIKKEMNYHCVVFAFTKIFSVRCNYSLRQHIAIYFDAHFGFEMRKEWKNNDNLCIHCASYTLNI